MSETWYKDYCPKCNAMNWVCNGDVSDLSGIDVDGIKCWKCGWQWQLGEEGDLNNVPKGRCFHDHWLEMKHGFICVHCGHKLERKGEQK
jgi:transcription elongation factor Elf1